MAETLKKSEHQNISIENDKPVSDDATDVEINEDGKNMKQIKCLRCPSTILVSGTATLVVNKFVLPNSASKEGIKESNPCHKYWCVDNMYAFENIGFSKTVDGVKYLICADCEIGPIGYHDMETKLSYVSVVKTSYC